MPLIDSHGRRVNYLRLSVTDRCNLRCRYCMPANGVPKLPHGDILSFEDLHRIASQAALLGIEKIRVTGGEPLVRKGVVEFIEKLSTIVRIKEIVLTTNGLLLGTMAADLRRAGVHRLNVSLDSLRPETFAHITRGGDLQTVLDGLDAAEQAGFPPPKINMVVMRGVNDGEIADFAALAVRKAYTVRFIEYMPMVAASNWQAAYISGDEVLERIKPRFTLEPIDSADPAAPARYYRIANTAARVGIISPISHDFCNRCNRIRVTAAGLAKGCLFSTRSTDLKPVLRAGDQVLREALESIVAHKEPRHRLLEAQPVFPITAMAQIGG